MIRFITSVLTFMIAFITNTPFYSGSVSYNESQARRETGKEYHAYTDDMSDLPVKFRYGSQTYKGFGSFTQVKRETVRDGKKEVTTAVLLHQDKTLQATVESAYYPNYNAYEWTVSFENVGNKNTKVLSDVSAANMLFYGSNPVLKGIYGDVTGWYEPYEKNIGLSQTRFVSLDGRATAENFPYFNLENDRGGVMIAIGWPGTWKASFDYDYQGNTQFIGTGTVGMSAYLKPGEKVRSPLMSFLRYYERNEDLATNLWREWYLDCNLPKENATENKALLPTTSVFITADSPNESSDGSVGFEHSSWKKTYDKILTENLYFDYHWFDAGWYVDEFGETIWSDWTRTGTLTLDRAKWPDASFQEMTGTMRKGGTKTLLWFEPERLGVHDFDVFCKNFRYDKNWKIGDNISNLGNEDCLMWTYNQIINVLETTGADLYREDFNASPYKAWRKNDLKEGLFRAGITENKYVQGHLRLWDMIIAYCGRTGRSTVIDSCASGGRRNDLETMRRAVPLLRSDADRSTPEVRLSISTTLSKWLPYNGSTVLTDFSGTPADIRYLARASYLCHNTYCSAWTKNENIQFDLTRDALTEWKKVSQYYDDDYYVLTPFHGHTDNTGWTAWMYFDSERESGVLQAFRQSGNGDSEYNLSLKGVEDDKTYNLIDADGINSLYQVKGKDLKNGVTITLSAPSSAAVIFIEKQ